MTDNAIAGLLTAVRDAVAIWYNMSGTVACYDIVRPAPNYDFNHEEAKDDNNIIQALSRRRRHLGSRHGGRFFTTVDFSSSQDTTTTDNNNIDPAAICHEKAVKEGSWNSICCNDELNLIMTYASGLGRDAFWPPNYPRGTKTYNDLVDRAVREKRLFYSCSQRNDDLFGYPPPPLDPWSTWLDTNYGDRRAVKSLKNVVFSNGALDPWIAGGVVPNPFSDDNDDDINDDETTITTTDSGLTIQNLGNDVVLLIMKHGGHHTDLMYSSHHVDPQDIRDARAMERDYIAKWIKTWNQKQQQNQKQTM